MSNTHPHTFHIPVMGLGYTIDSPIKVAHFGISSVMSIGDDMLIEKIRKHYCVKNNLPYIEIPKSNYNHRALRITSYLNLVKKLVDENFKNIKLQSFTKDTDLSKYFEMLNPDSDLSKAYVSMKNEIDVTKIEELQASLKSKMICGSIDVNIMSKVDNPTFNKKKEQLPIEFNDAMAALRGFAESELTSSIVISAGLNPRLFAYFESFKDFLPDQNGELKKKVILKVSDYRSAQIQGKFLAKKGVWVSEFRIESGLNCGGHAFATQGELLGPILNQFNEERDELINSIFETYIDALKERNLKIPERPMPIQFSAQGGVGNYEEQLMLLNDFNIDSVGWGTPFLLVPEAVSIDSNTVSLLEDCSEEDLYTSGISPLGIPFNTIKGSTLQENMETLIEKNRPGSSCPKKFLSFNTEFTEKPICTASRQYVNLKLQSLENSDLSPIQIEKEKRKVLAKTCLCSGLGTAALIDKGIDTKVEGSGVAVCPGPNIAYFSKSMTLKEMVDHIYGKINMLNSVKRPHMFLKELNMYIEHYKKEFAELSENANKKQLSKLTEFKENIEKGINYYANYFATKKSNSFDRMNELRDEFLSKLLELKPVTI
ncbi:MAG: hypothetical protein HYR91_04365 [Flavobacteriia bacterium]|nr:hypothetical protein [Flavobacteriia bacterium]